MATNAVKLAAQVFLATWHVGRRVRHGSKTGTITAVQGTGPAALIIVSFDKGGAGAFSPGSLTPI